MTIAKPHIQQTDPPGSPRDTLPTMYDLPSEDPEEPGLPDEYHLWQAELLSYTFSPPTYPPDRVFTASDLNFYYDINHPGWYKRPEWFAVVGVPRLYDGRELRLSYVLWQEGVRPTVIVEFLSPSTKNEDLGKTEQKLADNEGTIQQESIIDQDTPPTKWKVYERILGVPYYIVFDGATNELQAFELKGDRYQKIELTEPKIWIPTLHLGLGLWQGEYRGKGRQWLRWYDRKGNWMPTEVERERREKELAQQRADRLAERLRQLGINPDDLT